MSKTYGSHPNNQTRPTNPARSGTPARPGQPARPSAVTVPRPAGHPARPAARRSLAVAAAVLAAVVIWLVAVAGIGLDLAVGAGAQAQQVTLASAIAAPLLAGAAAWGLLALLERRSTNAVRTWRITGWLFLAVSLLGPLGMGPAPAVLAVLLLMHVCVGTILMLGLPLPRRVAAAYSGETPGKEFS